MGEGDSDVLPGSVLAPIMFLIYVMDMIDGMKSFVTLFVE